MKLFTTEKMDEFVQREFIYKYNGSCIKVVGI